MGACILRSYAWPSVDWCIPGRPNVIDMQAIAERIPVHLEQATTRTPKAVHSLFVNAFGLLM